MPEIFKPPLASTSSVEEQTVPAAELDIAPLYQTPIHVAQLSAMPARLRSLRLGNRLLDELIYREEKNRTLIPGARLFVLLACFGAILAAGLLLSGDLFVVIFLIVVVVGLVLYRISMRTTPFGYAETLYMREYRRAWDVLHSTSMAPLLLSEGTWTRLFDYKPLLPGLLPPHAVSSIEEAVLHGAAYWSVLESPDLKDGRTQQIHLGIGRAHLRHLHRLRTSPAFVGLNCVQPVARLDALCDFLASDFAEEEANFQWPRISRPEDRLQPSLRVDKD